MKKKDLGRESEFLVQQRSGASARRKATYVDPVEMLSFGIARGVSFSLSNEEHSNKPISS